MAWHGYIHYSEIGDGLGDDRTLAGLYFRGMGAQNTRNPQYNNHARANNAGDELIVEALYQDNELTRDAVYGGLAAALGISQARAEAIVLAQLLGGGGATWEQSRQAAMAVIAADVRAWE